MTRFGSFDNSTCKRVLDLLDRTMKIRGWNSRPLLFFERQDERVVLTAERLEGGPVSSRVSTFPDVFSMAENGSKCTEGGRQEAQLSPRDRAMRRVN